VSLNDCDDEVSCQLYALPDFKEELLDREEEFLDDYSAGRGPRRYIPKYVIKGWECRFGFAATF
jgi:hypothetical protein